jgi:hypothetical protein
VAATWATTLATTRCRFGSWGGPLGRSGNLRVNQAPIMGPSQAALVRPDQVAHLAVQLRLDPLAPLGTRHERFAARVPEQPWSQLPLRRVTNPS